MSQIGGMTNGQDYEPDTQADGGAVFPKHFYDNGGWVDFSTSPGSPGIPGIDYHLPRENTGNIYIEKPTPPPSKEDWGGFGGWEVEARGNPADYESPPRRWPALPAPQEQPSQQPALPAPASSPGLVANPWGLGGAKSAAPPLALPSPTDANVRPGQTITPGGVLDLQGRIPPRADQPGFAATLGLGIGDWRRGLPLLGLGVVVGAVIGYRSAMSPELAAVYPLGSTTLAPAAFTIHALGYLLYYAGFEYHYRGFLLLGLREHLGAGPANLLRAGLATLVHLGKPPVELAAVIPASLLFGWIALRSAQSGTRSRSTASSGSRSTTSCWP